MSNSLVPRAPLDMGSLSDLAHVLRSLNLTLADLEHAARRADELQAARPRPLGAISRRDREGLRGRGLIIWSGCLDCGAERWVSLHNPTAHCRQCSARRGVEAGHQLRAARSPKPGSQRGERNNCWRGGIKRGPKGYVYEWVAPGDPMRAMTSGSYVLQHRLVMAQALGRPLERWESVHHRNGDRTDNRIENLELWKRPHPSGQRVSEVHS